MHTDMTRRSAVKNMMAATVALTGGAVALPAVANAVPQWKDRGLPLAVNDARPELRDAIHALEAAHDNLMKTGRAHAAAFDLYNAWEEKNRNPGPGRAFRKWCRRVDSTKKNSGSNPSMTLGMRPVVHIARRRSGSRTYGQRTSMNWL